MSAAPEVAALGDPRDAEVDERDLLDPVLRVQEDVLGLHVAVHHPLRMRNRETIEDRAGDRDGASRLEGALPLNDVAELHTVDEVHDDREARALGHEVADRDDVRRAQREQDGPFA